MDTVHATLSISLDQPGRADEAVRLAAEKRRCPHQWIALPPAAAVGIPGGDMPPEVSDPHCVPIRSAIAVGADPADTHPDSPIRAARIAIRHARISGLQSFRPLVAQLSSSVSQ